MYLLLTDETNLRPTNKIKFFVYGGLIIPLEKFEELHRKIKEVREKAGYKPKDLFKFDTNTRPKHVTKESATKAKRSVVELCLNSKCSFIVYVIHHGIAYDQEKRLLWAADHVIGRFNQYLQKINNSGICLVDSFPIEGESKYLKEKFTTGLKLQDGSSIDLENIKLFGNTGINASHVSSAVDIILGSFRYCINNPKNTAAASLMMKRVMSMLWHEISDGRLLLKDKGLILRPVDPGCEPYKTDYNNLLDSMINLLKQDG